MLALRFLNWVISENGEGHLALKRALEIKVVGVQIPKPDHLEVKKQIADNNITHKSVVWSNRLG